MQQSPLHYDKKCAKLMGFKSRKNILHFKNPLQGTLTGRGRLSTVDLLIKVACFVKKNHILNIKMS